MYVGMDQSAKTKSMYRRTQESVVYDINALTNNFTNKKRCVKCRMCEIWHFVVQSAICRCFL